MKEVPWHVVRTRGGLEIQLQEASGRVAISMPDGTSVTVDNGKVVIEAAAFMEIDASQVKVSAGVINVTAGMTKFDGVVQCDTLVANSVVAASYTPGAGNQL